MCGLTPLHNCVGGYAHRIWTCNCYIYRVLAPERATLSIVKSGGNQWFVEQLSAGSNAPVRPATLRAIETWLGNNQLGI